MKNIAVVFGGFSGEDVVSVKSAATILKHIDKIKNRVFKVNLSKKGWDVCDLDDNLWAINKSDFSFSRLDESIVVDGVINIIHGTPGEDGKLQGYFDMLGIPYNGCDVLVSSLTFNKGFCNHYLKQQGITVADSILLTTSDEIDSEKILAHVGLPCFVKPNDGGSSIGVSKVSEKGQLNQAISNAFFVSDRVLIESFVQGVEITCGVINLNGTVTPLAVTEIEFESDFFDFEAKYNSSSTKEITPARISEEDYNKTMELSKRIYQILGCKGFFRADYILENGELFLIEVNTVPGMSSASLMPQQLEYANINVTELLQFQIDNL
ncbi:MAG: D-alanine--D-alanine ligase [Salibacteraceae bacterium]